MQYVSKIVKKLQIVCKKTKKNKQTKKPTTKKTKKKNKKHALQKLVGVIRIMTCSLNYQSVMLD